MELGVSHEQSLSSSTPIVDNIFDKYNKNLVPIRSLSDHDTTKKMKCSFLDYVQLLMTAQAGRWTQTLSTTPIQPKK